MANGTRQRPSAFSLAQGGEFAFVLISFCLGLGLLPPDQCCPAVAIVAVSMALAPLLILFDEKVVQPRFAAMGNSGMPM